MDHYTTTKNIADGLHKALENPDQVDRMIEALQGDSRTILIKLIQPDAPTSAQLEQHAEQSFRFIGTILAKSLGQAASLFRELEANPSPNLRTSLVFTLSSLAAMWLDREVSEDSLSGTVKDIFDAFYLCFIALRDLDNKEDAMLGALLKLGACQAEQLLDPTKDCGAERSNYDAAVNDYLVALNNLPNAC